MNSIEDALSRLRAADPARSVAADAPSTALLSSITAQRGGAGSVADVRRRTAPRRLGLAAGLLAGAATVAVGTVSWPRHHTPPPSVAGAVTTLSDGGVRVRVFWSDFDNLARLQAQLRAQHINALVLKADPACTLPLPDGDPAIRQAVPVDTPSADGHLWTIYPSRVPPGDTVVIGLDGPLSSGDRSANLFLTARPPTCLPPSLVAGPP